jgi:cytochrome c-type biogenesis protein CcmF
MFLGFAGGEYSRTELVQMSPGDQVAADPYVVRYVGLSVTDDGRKQAVTARVEVLRDGAVVQHMFPATWFFRGREDEPTTEVALRRELTRDLYVVFKEYDAATQQVALEVTVNPLVNWIWFGVGVLAIGTGIALLPERALAFAASRVPEGAVTTGLLVLALVLGGATRAVAQHVEAPPSRIIIPRTPLEKELQGSLICMCGTCGRKRVGECTCSVAADMRAEIASVVKTVKTRDEAIQYFVTKYGSQEVLASPIDKGFNRLAWLLPYGLGLVGLLFAGRVALRWSRPAAAREPLETAPAGPASHALNERLDDELRDLD